MRLACPNCSAEYEVPDAALAAGPRLLRCARCSHQFEAALPGASAREMSPAPADAPLAVGPPPHFPPAAPSWPAPTEAPPAPLAPGPESDAVAPDRPPPTRGPARSWPMDPEPASRPRRFRPRRPPPGEAEEEGEARPGAGLAIGWVLSIALVLAVGWATYHFHAEIIAAWPPAARLYQALGVQ